MTPRSRPIGSIEAIIRKEWAEIVRNRGLLFTFGFLAATFLGLPILLGFVLPGIAGEALTQDPDLGPFTALLSQLPGFGVLSQIEQFQVAILRQFLPLFLVLPVMGAMGIATYSIIGEKASRSLEALLATPISTRDFMLAKSLSAAIPPVLGTYIVFAVYAAIVFLGAGSEVTRFALDGAAWLMVLLITPLVAFFALGIGVIVSSRVNDPRTAQQVGGVFVIPVVAAVLGQSSGVFLLGPQFVLIGAVVLLVLDAIVLTIGVRLFNRETILTRWK